jgi:hypothetical protein
MVSDPYGSGINHFRGVASVESYRWRRCCDLAYRMVRGCTRHSCNLFWLPPAQPADVGSLLRISYQANARSWAPFGAFLGIRHALSARQTREPAGLLKKIRLGAIDGAITLRRWNMSLPILRLEFLKAAILRFLTAYEEKDLCSQDASGKRFASERRRPTR